MKRINKHNPFGYKVGYYNDSRLFICRFKDRNYFEATKTVAMFKQIYASNINWIIKPIRISEFARGIWRECPF